MDAILTATETAMTTAVAVATSSSSSLYVTQDIENDNNMDIMDYNNVTDNFTSVSTLITGGTNDLLSENKTKAFENDELMYYLVIFADFMHEYYMPIICGTGSLGNILSIVVFFKTKLRKLSSSFYLAALAMSDTCYLIVIFTNWLNFYNIGIYNREYLCELFTFLSYLACFCSVWFVVAFTVERFIAVMYPLRRQTMCTVRRAKMVIAGVTLMGLLHSAPYLVFSALNKANTCDVKDKYTEIHLLYNFWDTIIVFVVPLTTIAILNTYTGCTVWKFATVRRTLTMQKIKTQSTSMMSTSSSGPLANGMYRITSFKRQKSTNAHPNGQNNTITNKQQQQEQQIHSSHQYHPCEITQKSGRRKLANSSQLKVTKMLLIVSTVFVCFNLPSFCLRIKALWESNTGHPNMRTVAWQYFFNILYVTNFGINFVLYCVSGQNFRKAVLSIFRRVSNEKREALTQVTVSEYCRNTGTSTRRRMMTQHCWNEMHELHPLK